MKKLMLAPAVLMFLMLPGDATGYPHGSPGRSAPAFHPAVSHTPAFVAPHYSAPHFNVPYYNAPHISTPHYNPPHYNVSHYNAPHYNAPHFVAPRTVIPQRPAAPIHTEPSIVRTSPSITHPTGPRVTNARPLVGNHFATANRLALANRGVYVHRANGYYLPGYAHYHHRYESWLHGYWHGWYTRPWFWLGTGVAANWLWGPGESWAYADPYYVPPPVGVAPVYDYSQPIPVPAPILMDDSASYDEDQGPPPESAPAPADNETAVANLFNQAKQAFLANDYVNAQRLIDQAIPMQPKDTTLHQFRALTFFAQQKYQEAAAAIYAVLAVAPGWDWDTMRALYPDTQTYTNQLRALEQYTKSNPNDAAARFLLAYHYLVLDALDAAARKLQSVVALQPNDQLAAYLLNMISNKGGNRPAPGG
jgi:tetratricopeptide (TPR) repeat protein